ncbi:MAG: DUF4175 domain-containing protein [Kiloniellales bacterium]|nr:DUF4175 domain-containing protein [Kiloniellales bacterium]
MTISRDHAKTRQRRSVLGGASAEGPPLLSARLRAAQSVLFWETLWPRIWPLVGLAGLFLALALLDLLPALPAWAHTLVLAGFLGAAALFSWRALRRLHWPALAAARHRVERDSGLDHRPLTGLEDHLASGGRDPAASALWELHRRRLLARVAKLRLGLPRASLVRVDPLGLRTLVVLLLVVAAIDGRNDWQDRLVRAVLPQAAAAAALASGLDVWITPPEYTGLPPLLLDKDQEPKVTVTVPIGSQVLAQVQGGRSEPSLRIGDEETAFESFGGDAYRISREIRVGTQLEILQAGRPLAAWPIQILPDNAPEIEFLSPPGGRERNALRLEFGAADDYGLETATAEIRRLEADPETEPLVLELPLPGHHLKTAESASYHDLTPHPWAGLPVEITLLASDALGQTGRSDPVRTVLPERIFNHPVARALVELRKQLTLEPERRFPVIQVLRELYERPDHYFHDIVVALAIRSAERRLGVDPSDEAVPEVQKLLWDTALRIEEGELALAEADLREIQEALQEALAEGAPDEEIQELLNQLEQAMDRFLSELSEQLMQDLGEQDGELPEMNNADQLINSEDLQSLIEAARELARTGQMEAAREMLAQLRELLENLRANPFAQQMDDANRQAMQMMQEMERMIGEQQDLLDRSFDRAQRQEQFDPQRMGRENSNDAQRQESLRRALGEMMRQLGDALGEIPQPLGNAEQSMRGAVESLERGEPGEATGPQGEALDQMQQGMQSMVEAMMQQMGQGSGGRAGAFGWQPGTDRDPLGRSPAGQGLDNLGGVEIPDQMEMRRVREIMQELQRRAGQPSRPRFERDYIDRLLRRFE